MSRWATFGSFFFALFETVLILAATPRATTDTLSVLATPRTIIVKISVMMTNTLFPADFGLRQKLRKRNTFG